MVDNTPSSYSYAPAHLFAQRVLESLSCLNIYPG